MIIDQVINSVFNSNTYILSIKHAPDCWLVDCGDAEVLVGWITKNNKKLKGIFITHGHFDHIYGLNEIIQVFPDCIVYISQRGKENLYSEKLNISRYSGNSFIYRYDNLRVLKNNDIVKLSPELKMNVMETPGHDWSCLTFNIDSHLFTGDSFLPNYRLNTKFPKGNKVQGEESLVRIKNKIKMGARNIYPGHGSIKTSYLISN